MSNIFFKTLLKRGAKGAKGERGINYEVPQNAIIGFDDDDGEGGTLPTPAGYDDATIPPYLIEKTIRANGSYDPTNEGAFGYSNVNVDIGSAPTLVQKTITANGTYNPADDNADGYSSVTVNVSGGSIVKYLDNKLVGSTVEEYFTISLDIPLVANKWYLLAIQDDYVAQFYPAIINHGIFYFDGTNITNFEIFWASYQRYQFDITSTTIKLKDWTGSWRNIYATITEATTEQFYFPSVT